MIGRSVEPTTLSGVRVRLMVGAGAFDPQSSQDEYQCVTDIIQFEQDLNRPANIITKVTDSLKSFFVDLGPTEVRLTRIHILNIVPCPLCVCGSIEDTSHFLFRCPLYHNLRPTVNVLLYGIDNLSFSDNKQIFNVVHDFLIKKRFQANR